MKRWPSSIVKAREPEPTPDEVFEKLPTADEIQWEASLREEARREDARDDQSEEDAA
jgi:hypothetical protein